MKAILLVIIVSTLGCGNHVYYEEQQFANRNECYQLPLSQREECLQKTNKRFDEYNRERKELIGEN
jgi:hypothetical protein